MRRKKAIVPAGVAEVEGLRAVGAFGEPTVADILERLSAQRKPAYAP